MSVNEAKYFTTSGYSKFASKVFETRIKKGLVNMSSISNLAKNSDLNAKLKLLWTKSESKAEQNKIVKRQEFDSSYFRGKKRLEDDDMPNQNYLVFQPIYRYFKNMLIAYHISEWK